MTISQIKFVCYATSLGIFLAMTFRLALLISPPSNSTLMTPNGKSHVIELLLVPNQLQIKLTLYVNSRKLKSVAWHGRGGNDARKGKRHQNLTVQPYGYVRLLLTKTFQKPLTGSAKIGRKSLWIP
jgi:hypothetical protein